MRTKSYEILFECGALVAKEWAVVSRRRFFLQMMAKNGDLERIKIIVEHEKNEKNDFSFSFKNNQDQTLLHFAAMSGKLALCKYFIEDLNLPICVVDKRRNHNVGHAPWEYVDSKNIDLIKYFKLKKDEYDDTLCEKLLGSECGIKKDEWDPLLIEEKQYFLGVICSRRHLNVLKIIFDHEQNKKEHGMDFNFFDGNGKNLMFSAAAGLTDNVALVDYLHRVLGISVNSVIKVTHGFLLGKPAFSFAECNLFKLINPFGIPHSVISHMKSKKSYYIQPIDLALLSSNINIMKRILEINDKNNNRKDGIQEPVNKCITTPCLSKNKKDFYSVVMDRASKHHDYTSLVKYWINKRDEPCSDNDKDSLLTYAFSWLDTKSHRSYLAYRVGQFGVKIGPEKYEEWVATGKFALKEAIKRDCMDNRYKEKLFEYFVLSCHERNEEITKFLFSIAFDNAIEYKDWHFSVIKNNRITYLSLIFSQIYNLLINSKADAELKEVKARISLGKWIWAVCIEKHPERVREALTFIFSHRDAIKKAITNEESYLLLNYTQDGTPERFVIPRAERAFAWLHVIRDMFTSNLLVYHNNNGHVRQEIEKETLDMLFDSLLQGKQEKIEESSQTDSLLCAWMSRRGDSGWLDVNSDAWCLKYIFPKFEDSFISQMLQESKFGHKWLLDLMFKAHSPGKNEKIKWFFNLISENINNNESYHQSLRQAILSNYKSFLLVFNRYFVLDETNSNEFYPSSDRCPVNVLGFIRNFEQFLGLYHEARLAIYQQDSDSYRMSRDDITDEYQISILGLACATCKVSGEDKGVQVLLKALIGKLSLDFVLKSIDLIKKMMGEIKQRPRFKRAALRQLCDLIVRKTQPEQIERIQDKLIEFIKYLLQKDQSYFRFISECAIREDEESYRHEVMIAKIAMPLYVFGGCCLNISPHYHIKEALFHYYLSVSAYWALLCIEGVNTVKSESSKISEQFELFEPKVVVGNLLRWALYHGQLGQLRNIVRSQIVRFESNCTEKEVKSSLEKFVGRDNNIYDHSKVGTFNITRARETQHKKLFINLCSIPLFSLGMEQVTKSPEHNALGYNK